MTHDSTGQAGALEFRESYDSIVSDYRKSLERIEDALVLKGLSICEAYIEGRARIAVEFAPHPSADAYRSSLITVWNNQIDVFEASPGRLPPTIQNIEPLNFHHSVCADQDVMFIGDVEPMNAMDFLSVNLERLYLVDNKIQDLGAGESSCFLSVNGGFRVLPRVSERELSVSVDGPAVGLDKGAISVVKGSSKVVDGITDDGRCVAGNPAPESSVFPTVRIGLGLQGFDVVHHVGPNNRFKLLDVMIGPFYF